MTWRPPGAAAGDGAPADAPIASAVGLGARAFWLLGAGALWLIPAAIDRRALGLVLRGTRSSSPSLWILDLRRLPAPAQLRVTRELDRSAGARPPTTVRADARATTRRRHRGAAGRRAVDGAPSATCPKWRSPCRPARPSRVEYGVTPRERGDTPRRAGHGALRERLGARRRAGRASPIEQTVRVYPDLHAAQHARAAPGAQPVDGRRAAAGAPARRRPRVRAAARLSRRRRAARRVLDGDGAARQARHPALSPGAQPDRVDHARRQPPAARARRRSHQARRGGRRGPGAGPRRARRPAIASGCSPTAAASTRASRPIAARGTCAACSRCSRRRGPKRVEGRPCRRGGSAAAHAEAARR